jgi:arsenate reductase-like glutaredoxin family protein
MSYAEYISQLINCTLAGLNSLEKTALLRLMDRYDKNEGIHSVIRFKRQQQFSAEVEKQFSALLDRNLITVIHKNRFRGGSRNYVLTTCGLFYTLSENQVFSGISLSKYCENVILQLLLFQYLEETSVKNWSPRVRTIISVYLHKCCVTSKRTIETMRSLKIPHDREKYLEILELDLKTFAFDLGIRLTRLYSRYVRIFKNRDLEHVDRLNHEEDRMLSLLLEDDKFFRFRSNILKELDEAFEELARLGAE